MIKSIPGFPDYEISEEGVIQNVVTGHYLSQFPQKKGGNIFLSVTLYRNGKGSNRFVANLVYETFIGSIPRKYKIIYRDENRTNCSLDNLFLEVRNRDEDGYKRLLAIRALDRAGYTSLFIANVLKITDKAVRNILNGVRYG